MSDDDFYLALMEANTILIENHQERQRKETKEQLKKLYLQRDASFRGFRQL